VRKKLKVQVRVGVVIIAIVVDSEDLQCQGASLIILGK